MAGKNSGSDNPWAEMSRLNLQNKEAKAPAPDSPRAASVKSEEAKAEAAPATAAAGVTAKAASSDVESAVAEEVVAEYSLDELQEMSLKDLQEIARNSGIEPEDLSKEDLINAIAGYEVALTEENVEDEVEILLEDEESLEAEEIDGEMSLEEALAILGEDSETEEDFSDAEFEEVETEVLEGDVNFESDGNN
jgi:hypothetical protein